MIHPTCEVTCEAFVAVPNTVASTWDTQGRVALQLKSLEALETRASGT
jgi:hypothetical protein